jgi:hypothetical protein
LLASLLVFWIFVSSEFDDVSVINVSLLYCTVGFVLVLYAVFRTFFEHPHLVHASYFSVVSPCAFSVVMLCFFGVNFWSNMTPRHL